eukprot:3663896-Pyramimonas_sp.AAC.1
MLHWTRRAYEGAEVHYHWTATRMRGASMRFRGVNDSAPVMAGGEQEVTVGPAGADVDLRFQRLRTSKTPMLLSIHQMEELESAMCAKEQQADFKATNREGAPNDLAHGLAEEGSNQNSTVGHDGRDCHLARGGARDAQRDPATKAGEADRDAGKGVAGLAGPASAGRGYVKGGPRGDAAFYT